ncbi:MAG: thioesterase family protein [Nitrospirae bacterium]|nr:thioesterase family protein [Nitrospirota bacterium]
MTAAFETYRGKVDPSEIDHMGHMNIKYYAEKFDQATWKILMAIGVTPRYVQETGKGFAVLESLTKYLHELLAGTSVLIETVLLEVTSKKVRILHRLKKMETGEIVATNELLGIHFDLKLRKSCEMPNFIFETALSYKITNQKL